MSDDKNGIKARISKLLNMTEERGATTAEAAVAMAKAQKLLSEHNLSITELRGSEVRKDHRESDTFPGYPWAKRIVTSIAELYDCRYVSQRGRRLNKMEHVFIGRQSNAETARLIAEFVVCTTLREADKRRREAKAAGVARWATNAFEVAASDQICTRARALWAEANADAIWAQHEAALRRNALRPDPTNLRPGIYRIGTFDAKWTANGAYVLLDAEAGTVYCRKVLATKPRGVTYMSIECTVGELVGGGTNYYYWVNRSAKGVSKSKAVVTPRNAELAAQDHEFGQQIGLHAQVGGAPTSKLIGQ